MNTRLAVIGLAGRVGGNLVADAFKLPPPDDLEVLALGRGGRSFVEIDRNAEAARDLRPHVLRHGYTIFQGHAFNGDEGDDVGSAHARMRALVRGEVDQLGGFSDAADGGFLDGFALADEGNDAAIVVRIHLAVEEVDAGQLHGFHDGVDFGLVTAFRKIGYAFYESRHGERIGDAGLSGKPGQ